MTAQNINKYQKTVAQGYVYGRVIARKKKKKKDPLYLCNCHSPVANRQTSIDFENVSGGGNCSIQNSDVNSCMYWLVNHRQLWFLYWASELCEYSANPEECTKHKRSEIPSQLCPGDREWQAWGDLSETSSTAFCRGRPAVRTQPSLCFLP